MMTNNDAVLEVVARYVGKTSSIYRYIAQDLSALASAPAGEAVAWQFRFKFTDGRWSGWAQVQSASDLEYLLDRYRALNSPAEGRALGVITPAADASEGEARQLNDGVIPADFIPNLRREVMRTAMKSTFTFTRDEVMALLATSAQPGDAGMVDYHTLRCWLLGIGVVGKIDGHDVIRRDSMVDMLTRWLASAPPQPNRASIAPEVAQSERPASGPVQADGREVDWQSAVERFLSWPLPDTVNPDGTYPAGGHRERWGHPLTGTHLLTADEARAMFQHCLGRTPGHAQDTVRLDWLVENSATVGTDGDGNWFVCFDWMPEGHDVGPLAHDQRAAIDAALAQQAHGDSNG